MSSLSVLFTIARRTDRDRFAAFYQKEQVPVGLVFMGQGTASREILSFLGIGETEKVILMSVLTQAKARLFTRELDIALKMDQPGAIAFTIPVHSLATLRALHNVFGDCVTTPMGAGLCPATNRGGEGGTLAHMEVEQAMEAQAELQAHPRAIENRILYELIIVIANKGYVGLVMEAARDAGATGGTTIHAGGTRDARNDSFAKVSIQNEKEIIWILTDADKRVKVMKAIIENAPEANAILFSIPVTDTAGLHRK
ncbi:MAG: hypothetical protein LBB86_07125 [Oscillospiraceae bacterium]|jgi:hypothetical protein|nr:hypothetical protein [Oscillospiraceae bacterium]